MSYYAVISWKRDYDGELTMKTESFDSIEEYDDWIFKEFNWRGSPQWAYLFEIRTGERAREFTLRMGEEAYVEGVREFLGSEAETFLKNIRDSDITYELKIAAASDKEIRDAIYRSVEKFKKQGDKSYMSAVKSGYDRLQLRGLKDTVIESFLDEYWSMLFYN